MSMRRADFAQLLIRATKCPDDGQTKIPPLGLADRERVAKIGTKRLGRRLVESRDGTIIGAEKATAAEPKKHSLGILSQVQCRKCRG
jgi:hypothetical protein